MSAAGLRLHFVDDAFKSENYDSMIYLSTNICESYDCLQNAVPVSAIYSISTDANIGGNLELEHCYEGNLDALAFAYSINDKPPFQFKIADEYSNSFTASHGLIHTNHFSHWVILWIKSMLGYPVDDGRPVGRQMLILFWYYKKEKSHIKVNVILLKKLEAQSEVLI